MRVREFVLLALIAAEVVPLPSLAQVSGSLVELTEASGFSAEFDDLERAAARANQSTYNALVGACGGGVGPGCTQQQVEVFAQVDELIQTANEILGNGGPIDESLGSSPEGLGATLRWTASEEESANSRVATDFVNGQLANVNGRITALRFGATGFSLAGFPGLPAPEALGVGEGAVLGAAGDPDSATDTSDALARWGGFLNSSYGWGSQDPTTFENAFDYDSFELTGGFDYRILPDLVAGLVGGYSTNEVDFDAAKSVVDGGIDSDGFSVGTFGLYSWRDVYVSGFFNYQRMSYDIDRFITYPSFNPNVSSTNTRTKGDTDSDAYTIALNTGYTFRFGFGTGTGFLSGKPFLLEPYGRFEYTHVTIDGYDERNVDPGESFALELDEQDFDSLELSLGLRGSVAVSTPIGVFFPYVRGEWRFELEDDTRSTSSTYAGAGGVVDPASGVIVPFELDSDEIDDDYGVVVVGLQTIVLGGRERELGGPIAGRLSLFAEYRIVVALSDIDNRLVTGGVRYSF